MSRTLLGIVVLSWGSLLGCTGTEVIDCGLEPSAPACRTACEMDPSRSHCSDGGVLRNDGGADAGDADSALPCGVDCVGDTPLCDTNAMTCVQCLALGDCAGMGELGEDELCSDVGTCVQCRTDADCTEPDASVCSTDGPTAGSCVACSAGDVDGCAGVVDGPLALNVCDDSSGDGVCVECNAGDESACGDSVCDVLARTCTLDTTVGATPTCGACVNDRQCATGQTCAPTTFDGEAAGYYCLWSLSAPEMAPVACSAVRPFGTPRTVTSVNAQEAEVCTLRLTTCAAYNDFSSPGRGETSCTGADAPDADADCGDPDLDDGFCAVEDALSSLCSTRCTSAVDCVFGGVEYGCSAGFCTFVPR